MAAQTAFFMAPNSTPRVRATLSYWPRKDDCKQVAFGNSTAKAGSFEISFFSSTKLPGMKPLVQCLLVANLAGHPAQRLITAVRACTNRESAILFRFSHHFAHWTCCIPGSEFPGWLTLAHISGMCSKPILGRSLQNLLPSLPLEATSSRLLCLLPQRVEKVRRNKETPGFIPVPHPFLDALFPVSTGEILEKNKSHSVSLIRDPPWHCFIYLPHKGRLIPGGRLAHVRKKPLKVLNSNCILPLSDRSQK